MISRSGLAGSRGFLEVPVWRDSRAAHVCVVGVGGVGSWIIEALARSGVGALTMVDLDDVCVTNVNRQLPAHDGNIGRPKVDALAERVRLIHPECSVTAIAEFFTAASAAGVSTAALRFRDRRHRRGSRTSVFSSPPAASAGFPF